MRRWAATGVQAVGVLGVLGVLVVGALALPSAAEAGTASLSPSGSSSTLTIDAVDNIYGAGLSQAPDPGGNGGGKVPVDVPIPSGTTWISVSDVNGTVGNAVGVTNGPDGRAGTSSITATGSISGLTDSTSLFYLTGVFLDGPQPSPASTPPTTLNFSDNHSFTSLSPELDQVFYVGDGLTGTGSGDVQYFQVPTDATDLYLGFVDGSSFDGPPGTYSDNSGSLSAVVNYFTGQYAAPASTLTSASSTSATIEATDNVFGAGLTTPPAPAGDGAGTPPLDVPIPSGTTWMSFSDVTGAVNSIPGDPNGPDGLSQATSVSSVGAISGIVDSTGAYFLTGVFYDKPQTGANATPPPSLNFSNDQSFTSLSPELDQLFFIGDGLTGTGTGTVQYFQVPSGATDLYLGFVDAYSFQGAPGTYSNDSGSLSATVNFLTGQYSGTSSSSGAAAGTLLGGLNISDYCESVTNSAAQLVKGGVDGTNYAYDNWKCAASSGTLSIEKVCQWQYGTQAKSVVAKTNDANDAYSWMCYVASAVKVTRPTPSGASTPINEHTDVAPIAAAIGTPNQVFHSMGHNLVNAVITVAAILFITFPSVIFNQTFTSNYEEILLILANFRRRMRKAFGLKTEEAATDPPAPSAPEEAPTSAHAEMPGHASRPWFYSVLVMGAILGGLLNPKFGFNSRSVADIGATLVAFALGTLIGWFISKWFRQHHHYPIHTYLHALPLGLGVAALCVVVSRLTNFEPGYLYGVIVSIAFVETLEERHNAHLTAISSLSTLAVALIAWFLWVPTNHFALEHGGNILLAIIDDVLASVFIGGLVGTVIGLLPLEFMPGGTLAKWRKDVWAIVFFVAVFLLVEVELRPAAGPTHPGGAPIVTALVLFAIFGGGTFWMRHFFAKRKAAKVSDDVVATSVAPPEVTSSGPEEA
jgi:hypothetical protein